MLSGWASLDGDVIKSGRAEAASSAKRDPLGLEAWSHRAALMPSPAPTPGLGAAVSHTAPHLLFGHHSPARDHLL